MNFASYSNPHLVVTAVARPGRKKMQNAKRKTQNKLDQNNPRCNPVIKKANLYFSMYSPGYNDPEQRSCDCICPWSWQHIYRGPLSNIDL